MSVTTVPYRYECAHVVGQLIDCSGSVELAARFGGKPLQQWGPHFGVEKVPAPVGHVDILWFDRDGITAAGTPDQDPVVPFRRGDEAAAVDAILRQAPFERDRRRLIVGHRDFSR